ncbi:MAG: helix-turn-helix domain-containing protein [Victivallaceae bacterium]|nr:helix-turn-helix domain-containing protein [Victivallaceae bacterium]
MKIKSSIPSGVLAAATGCLQPYCNELTPATLSKALSTFQSQNCRAEKLCTYAQVAELLSISLMSVVRMVKRGQLPRIKIGQRSVRIPLSAVENILKEA